MVSIIIPYYNHGKFIKETLESILSQNFSNLEVIIINDGSTDEFSLAVLGKINHPKVFIYHTDNKGVCHARNYGVSLAKGNYLLFLDADDKIANEYISEAYSILKANSNIKAVSGKVKLFGEKSGYMNLPKFSLEKLIARNILIISCLIRKEDFEASGGFNPIMKEGFEDWDFWLSFFENGGDVHHLDKVVFFYRIQNISRNHTIGKQNFKKLRRQIYYNHKSLYSSLFLDPTESFEYLSISDSKEYQMGILFSSPLKKMLNFYRRIKRSF